MTDPSPSSLRLCVYGCAPTQAWLDALRRQAPEASALLLLGEACDAAMVADASYPERVETDPALLARKLAVHFPDDTFAIVFGGTLLPDYAIARLRHALQASDAAAVGSLDNRDPQHSPLPSGQRSDAPVTQIDSLVLAYGEHRLIDSRSVSALLSLWSAPRLLAGQTRQVTADHVYVATPDQPLLGPQAASDLRDPLPASPLQPLRRRVLAALGTPITPAAYGVDGKPVLLHVLHGWGGGAERWVTDLATAWGDAHHLVLIARGSSQRRIHGEWLELRVGASTAPPLRSVALPVPIADTAVHDAAWKNLFDTLCRDYCVSHVLVSSLIGHSVDALRSGLPTTLMVHDHYPLWPLLHRDFGDRALAFDAAQLQRDLKTPGFEFSCRDSAHWQALRSAFVDAVIAAKATLVAPSHSALANELRLAPEFAVLDQHVIAHGLAAWPIGTQALPAPAPRDRLRLVVVGRIRAGKGGELLTAALDGLREHADLLLLGAGAAAHEFFGAHGVHIVLDYQRADLPRQVADWAPDAALLLPTVAETYSYALSELNSLGLPVIATRVGALAERIHDGDNGLLVDPDAKALVARVAAIAADRGVLDGIREVLRQQASIPLTTMVARYRDLLAVNAGGGARYPLRTLDIDALERAAAETSLEAANAEAQRLGDQLEAASRLAEQRGHWGHALDRDLGQAQARVQRLQSDLGERAAWAKALNKELVETHARVQLLQSDLGERAAWAKALDKELVGTRARVQQLQNDVVERTAWALRLDAEVVMHQEQITQLNARWSSELERQLDERLQWVQRLQAELSERTDWGNGLQHRLHELQAEFDERTTWALNLDAEVAAQREQLHALHAIARDRDAILASRTWRMMEPLRRLSTLLRRVRLSLGYRRRRLTSAISRTRGSLARRGLVATIRRALYELRRAPIQVVPVLDGEPAVNFEPFAVPTHARPRVSIVIPVYNKIHYTVACLRSLAEHAGRVGFEVIVVDDGSSDDTPLRLDDIDGIRSLRNKKNLGFVGSCNAGAIVAKGEFVLFLNNDTVVTAGWLDALVACHEQEPKAGLIGAKLVYPDGRLQEAGGIIFNDGSGWNYGRFDDPRDPRYCYRREVDYCSGAAILIRRDLFEQLGRFDQRYAPAYYEDTDLAFAVRAAGYRVIVEPASTVIHFEGVTAGTDTASGVKQYQVVNREKFLAKWADALARQPRPYPETPIGIAATHRAKLRALIIDATTPAPDQDSGSVRMVNLMRVLNDLGAQTSFMAENRAWIERDTPALQQLGVEVLYHPHVSDPVALFRERGHEWDVILLSRHYIAVNYIALAREYAPQARLVFDTVDLHYLREQRAADLEDRDDLRRTAASTRVQELQVMRDCDVTLVVSPVEQELLRSDAPDVRVEVLSNVHEVFGCRKPFAQRHDLVFVGGFQHPPNIDAVEWFVGSVFPLVRPHLPGVKFHIIGSKITDDVRAMAADDVIVHGYVEDISPFMDDSRISIAPLRYGAGVKGKVNMAMSYGLPVAATPIAVEGMHVQIGSDVLVAEDAAGLAAEIVRLYSDEALWNRLSANGLANVERHFSFDAAKVAVQRFLA